MFKNIPMGCTPVIPLTFDRHNSFVHIKCFARKVTFSGPYFMTSYSLHCTTHHGQPD